MAKMELSAQEKKTLKSMFWNSGLVFCGFNMVKMEGNAFTCTMAPAIEELYSDPEERKQALVRHNNFFNTHAVLFSFIAGLAYALEREKVTKGSVDDDTIENIKVALMGPTAGIGDSFFFNCYRVIIAGLCIGLSANGSLLGVILFVLLYGCMLLVYKYIFLTAGYRYGTSLITEAFERGIVPLITEAAGILGAIMVGALIAQNVSIKIALQPVIGGATIDFQGMLDSIMPGLLSLLLWGWSFSRVQKGWSPTKLIFMIMGGCVILAFFGIL